MDVVIPKEVAEEFAAVLAPPDVVVTSDGRTVNDLLRGARTRSELIGFALRAAASGVEVDWPRVLGTEI